MIAVEQAVIKGKKGENSQKKGLKQKKRVYL